MRKNMLCLLAVIALAMPCSGTEGKLKHTSYPEAGVLSSLATLTPSVGYWFGTLGVRLSGMYLGDDHSEVQLNLGYKLYDTERTQRTVNLMLGNTVASDRGADYDFTYLGIAYGMNFSIGRWSGFFFEAGPAVVLDDRIGNTEDELFVPVCVIGCLHRFLGSK